jgi:ABC-type multidrug transport system ATPase subunit
MIAHNYAQTLEICDRVLLMQHGEITFESQAAPCQTKSQLIQITRRFAPDSPLEEAGFELSVPRPR